MNANLSSKRASKQIGTVHFAEAAAWSVAGKGWNQLYGSFQKLGVSFEWHDFTCKNDVDWARSFHPESLEICLNLTGSGEVTDGQQTVEYSPLTAGFYWQHEPWLKATRHANQRHQFITIELAPEFLARHLSKNEAGLHPLVKAVLKSGTMSSGLGPVVRLSVEQQQIIASLRHPPVYAPAQEIWYQSKALEVVATFLYQPPSSEELFCHRQKQVAQVRVEKVTALLKSHLAEPPSLEEIGQQVGCSPFYLSRTFSTEMGMTISQYLRQLRMEKAALLLRAGKHNVTEAAVEVGYSSLSHFSQVFHETFGCCPGLYPLKLPSQKINGKI